MSRKLQGTVAERLARWLETSENRLLCAGAGAGNAADRRIALAVLAELRGSLSQKPPSNLKRNRTTLPKSARGAFATADTARFARTVGALRDRTLGLLNRSRARDAPAFRRLAGRAFDALLAGYLPEARESNTRGLRRRKVAGAPDAGRNEPSMRMILERVFEEGPLGMALVGLDFSFQSVNRTLCDMLGYKQSELEQLKYTGITHPDDIEKDVDLAGKAFRGEIPHYAIEKRYLKKDGESLWINLTMSVIRDKGGRPLYGLAMVEDIDERKRTSEELERRVSGRTAELSESEEKFRTIFENAPILVDSFDENGRCVLWNRECERTLGWTKEDILGSDDPLALAYPDKKLREKVLDAIYGADGVFREYEVRAKDGSKRTQLWADFRLPKGSLISTGLDITERKLAENALRSARDELEARVEQRTEALTLAVEALELEVSEKKRTEADLRESEANLTALIENATEAIFSVDTGRRLIAFNAFFRDEFVLVFGVEPHVGETIDDLMAGERLTAERNYLVSRLERALGGESFRGETNYRFPGARHFYLASYQPIVAGGRIRGATVYTKDITSLKTVEKALAGRLASEETIALVSQAFIHVGPEQMGMAIEKVLDLIGNISKADRSRFFLFTSDTNFVKEAYEWCAEGVAPQIERARRIPRALLPRAALQLVGDEGLMLSRLSDLPPGTDDLRAELEKEGIRSLLSVPLTLKGDRVGILGLHSVGEEREWSDETIRLLRTTAEIMTNAIARARAQSALAELSRRNKLLLDAAGEGIYGLDLDGRATFVNPAAAQMTGWVVEDLIGKSMHRILHHTRPDGRPYAAEECPIYASFKDGAVRRIDDDTFWRSDGSSFPAEYISTPIWEEGRLVGAVVTFNDITQRKRAEEALRRVVEGTSGSVGTDFFRSLVQHLAAALRVRFAFLAECIDGSPDRARMIAFWEGDRFGECMEYPIKGTPCENVFEHDQNFYPSGVRELYPEDAWLREIGAESYLAMPVYDSRGERLAHLGVLDDAPMSEELSRAPILRIFAARAGAEVERKRAEDTLAHQAEMEKVISAISKRFVSVGLGEMDGAIDDALRIMGSFSNVDRSYLLRFSEDLQFIDNSHEWCAEGIESQIHKIRNIPSKLFPWAVEKMIKLETVIAERTADLPLEAAAEIAEGQALGVKSLLLVPVVFRNQLIGSVGFSTVRAERSWSETTVQLLQRLSEIIANALARDMAEGEFKQLSHKNQLILDAAGDGIYGVDTQGKATFVNPAAARMTGWDGEELIGKPVHEILHHTRPDGSPYPMEECPIYATLTQGVVQNVSHEFLWRKDGSTFPVEYIATPIREKGRIAGVVVTFNDITERRRAEELRYHAQLLSQLPDAVLVMEGDGLISFWSKSAEELTGYPVLEMLGQDFERILAEWDPGGGLKAILNRVSGSGPDREYRGEHLIRRKDGQTRLIGLHLHPSPDPDGERHRWIGIAQDITEVRGLQEEMMQAQRMAEVGTLAAGVAHEINNPLTVLSGNLERLLEGAHRRDPNRLRFEQMKKVCDRISEVVKALGRASARGGEQWSRQDPNDVVEETLLLIEQLHARKDVKLVRRYGRAMPKLRLLQNGLQQVVMNIVMNAIDAVADQGEVIVATSPGLEPFIPTQNGLSPGEPSPWRGAAPARSVRIRVTDTGCGIPAEVLPKLFVPFFTTKEPGKGTGLGLAVARSIVSIHRGIINVESQVGTGTTVTIILPVS